MALEQWLNQHHPETGCEVIVAGSRAILPKRELQEYEPHFIFLDPALSVAALCTKACPPVGAANFKFWLTIR